MMVNAMDELRSICEKIYDGRFPENFTLMQARHMVEIYIDLARGKNHEFIEHEIARLLESIGIFVKKNGVGWVAMPVVG